MAADGYARATGKVGVCMATSGPGATNLVTGIATAQMDSVPMVAITGQVARAAIGKDAFQETDVTGITLPITKHNYLVMHASEIARAIKEAFHIASTGRPGTPVEFRTSPTTHRPVPRRRIVRRRSGSQGADAPVSCALQFERVPVHRVTPRVRPGRSHRTRDPAVHE